eukprot:scaffold106599_cov54-Phaeocystis_antarctica.AAC.1
MRPPSHARRSRPQPRGPAHRPPRVAGRSLSSRSSPRRRGGAGRSARGQAAGVAARPWWRRRREGVAPASLGLGRGTVERQYAVSDTVEAQRGIGVVQGAIVRRASGRRASGGHQRRHRRPKRKRRAAIRTAATAAAAAATALERALERTVVGEEVRTALTGVPAAPARVSVARARPVRGRARAVLRLLLLLGRRAALLRPLVAQRALASRHHIEGRVRSHRPATARCGSGACEQRLQRRHAELPAALHEG